jgi:5-methylcytosine-specific restriction enzyme subunit McrC
MTEYILHKLTEHQDSEAIDLPRSVVQQLQEHPTANIRISPSRTGWILRPKSIVGSLQIENHRFLVRSKIGMENLLSLLEIDLKSLKFSSESFDYGNEPDLLVALVRLFRVALDASIQQGLRRDYIPMSDRVMALRGRLDIKTISSHPGLPLPIACHFDEYTVDFNLNRVLKAALVKGLRVQGLPMRDRAALRRHLQLFEDVANGDYQLDEFDNWYPTRFEEPLVPAVRTAALLLGDASVSDRFGSNTAMSFLVDMNILVEKFLETKLKQALEGRLEVIGQASFELEPDKRFEIRPDLLFKKGKKVVLVGDIKYKTLNDETSKDKVKTSDLFQIQSYAIPHGVERAIILG